MDNRYSGNLGQEYELMKLALPYHDQLQKIVADTVADHCKKSGNKPNEVLEIGCGDGITTREILSVSTQLHLTAIDSNMRMVEKARLNLAEFLPGKWKVIEEDALDFLKNTKPASFMTVVSALTMHNFESTYRQSVIKEIFRVLIPGGMFLNGDKYVGDDRTRFSGLQNMVKKFFEVYLPLGKTGFLEDVVLHNIADQAPDRVMRESEALFQLADLGFSPISVTNRFEMQAVIRAIKPVTARR